MTVQSLVRHHLYTGLVVVIIGKLHQGQVVKPSPTKIKYTSSEYILQNMNHLLRLSGTTGMECRTKIEFGPHSLLETLPEIRHEARISVRCDRSRNPMQSYYPINV